MTATAFRARQSADRLSRAACFAVEHLECRRLLAAPQIDAAPFELSAVANKSLFVPVTTTDADGGRVSFSTSVTGPDGTTSAAQFLPRDNSFLQLDVAGTGSMLFKMFDNIAPETVRRINGLADSGWYDTLQIPRVIPQFVMQFGSPDNTLSGGPQFTFDDEFDPDTLFTGTGQLAMANSGKDTNGSQVFVTDSPVRFLDGNHTVFGQLVRGFDTQAAIMSAPTGPGDTPLDPISITRARTVTSDTDGVFRFIADQPGTYTVTVTATDPDGNASTRDYSLTVTEDTANSPPVFLPAQKNFVVEPNGSITFDTPAADPEGDDLEFRVTIESGDTDGEAGVNQDLQTVTYQPSQGFTGRTVLLVEVRQAGATSRGSTGDPWDKQTIIIGVGASQASGNVNPVTAHDNLALADARVATFTDTDTDADATADDWTATIDWGDGIVTTGQVVPGRAADSFDVIASHTYEVLAERLPVLVTLDSTLGARQHILGASEVIEVATLREGVMVVNGSSGNDVIRFDRNGNNFRATVNGRAVEFATNQVEFIEIYANAGDDDVAGSDDAPGLKIWGNSGNNTLVGGGGNDEIYGGTDDDVIDGGRGNDYIVVGGGNNYAMGGTGFAVTPEQEAAGGFNQDTLIGGTGNDTLSGGSDRNFIFATAGNNLINGSGGRDYLEGGTGNDTIRGWGNDDTLVAGEGNNVLEADGVPSHPNRGTFDVVANAGNNRLIAGPGNNLLFGGFGNDTLVSGDGADTLDGGDGDNTGEAVTDADTVLNIQNFI